MDRTAQQLEVLLVSDQTTNGELPVINCDKRQRERTKDGEQHRCVHPKAKQFLNVVGTDACMGCPLRKPNPQVTLPVVQELGNFNQACEYRWGEKKMCVVTGLPVTPESCDRCVKESKEEEAKFSDKVGNYASAVRRWVAAGRPVRSQERINEILNDHCLKCKMYDHEKKGCKSCGCAINASVFPLGNKLAMATESCPLGQFGPEKKEDA